MLDHDTGETSIADPSLLCTNDSLRDRTLSGALVLGLVDEGKHILERNVPLKFV